MSWLGMVLVLPPSLSHSLTHIPPPPHVERGVSLCVIEANVDHWVKYELLGCFRVLACTSNTSI